MRWKLLRKGAGSWELEQMEGWSGLGESWEGKPVGSGKKAGCRWTGGDARKRKPGPARKGRAGPVDLGPVSG